MKINFHTKKELTFIISGILILLGVVIFFIYSINFLVYNLNATLGVADIKIDEITRFNIEGLRELGIIIK